MKRPALDKNLDSKVFRDFYYLKEELVDFCRKNGLPVSGGKLELTERIAHFLETGTVAAAPVAKKKAPSISAICLDTKIEPNFVCSEKHRAFFREQIGSSFSFNVTFQKWLKSNTGKTYQEAVAAYHQILKDKKKENGKKKSARNFKISKKIKRKCTTMEIKKL